MSEATIAPSQAARTRAWFDGLDADARRPLFVRALATRGQVVPESVWNPNAEKVRPLTPDPDAPKKRGRPPLTAAQREERERAREEQRAKGRRQHRRAKQQRERLAANPRTAAQKAARAAAECARRAARMAAQDPTRAAMTPEQRRSEGSRRANAARAPEARQASTAAAREVWLAARVSDPAVVEAHARACSDSRLARMTAEERRESARHARAAQLTHGSESA